MFFTSVMHQIMLVFSFANVVLRYSGRYLQLTMPMRSQQLSVSEETFESTIELKSREIFSGSRVHRFIQGFLCRIIANVKKKGKDSKFCFLRFVTMIVVRGGRGTALPGSDDVGFLSQMALRQGCDSTISETLAQVNFPIVILLVVSKY